jgi:hypothetical protein
MISKEQNSDAKHPLHAKIGCLLLKYFKSGSMDVILDEACDNSKSESKQQIPLFAGDVKNRKSMLCKVDAMIVKDRSCKAVIEIEESGFHPTKICGKYLTTALSSSHYLRNDEPVKLMEGEVFFLQIVDAHKFTEDKKEQLRTIADRIKENTCGCVKSYELLLIGNEEIKWIDFMLTGKNTTKFFKTIFLTFPSLKPYLMPCINNRSRLFGS